MNPNYAIMLITIVLACRPDSHVVQSSAVTHCPASMVRIDLPAAQSDLDALRSDVHDLQKRVDALTCLQMPGTCSAMREDVKAHHAPAPPAERIDLNHDLSDIPDHRIPPIRVSCRTDLCEQLTPPIVLSSDTTKANEQPHVHVWPDDIRKPFDIGHVHPEDAIRICGTESVVGVSTGPYFLTSDTGIGIDYWCWPRADGVRTILEAPFQIDDGFGCPLSDGHHVIGDQYGPYDKSTLIQGDVRKSCCWPVPKEKANKHCPDALDLFMEEPCGQ